MWWHAQFLLINVGALDQILRRFYSYIKVLFLCVLLRFSFNLARLIEEAHVRAALSELWDESEYVGSRMGEKINLLADELPEFLVENKAMYSILSKGIHELSEAECLAAFPVVKVGIEIILDVKLESAEKEKKLAAAKKAIAALSGSI